MANDTLSRLSPGQRLSAARARACQIMPYFRSGLQSLVPQDAPGIGTIGVTDKSILMVDQEVLGGLTAAEAGACLLHNYLHVYFRHKQRFDALVKTGALREQDRTDWDKAADCEINDNLVEAGCRLPKLGGEEPSTPAGLGLKPHRTAEEYVVEIIKKKQKGPQNKQGSGGGAGGQPPPSGSGAGNPLPNEPDGSGEDGGAEGRSELEQHMQRRSDSGNIQQAARGGGQGRGIGNVPSGLLREANAQLKPAEVKWQDKLSRAVRQAVTFVNGNGDFTFTQRARMQSSMEYVFQDDAPVLPGEWAPRAEVLVAEDTSGSMCDPPTRAKILGETKEILRNMGGAKVTYVSIDCAIHTVQRVGKIGEIKAKGGGGTDFNPLFEALPTFKPKPHIVIFFTDGYGPAPEKPPPNVHVIWVIINGQSPVKWGEHIHVNTRQQEDAA